MRGLVGWLVRPIPCKDISPKIYFTPCVSSRGTSQSTLPLPCLGVPRGARGGELFLIFETERMRFRFGERSMLTDSQPFRLLFELCLSRLWPNQVEIYLLVKPFLSTEHRSINRCSQIRKNRTIDTQVQK